jgi:hypothetical protein
MSPPVATPDLSELERQDAEKIEELDSLLQELRVDEPAAQDGQDEIESRLQPIREWILAAQRNPLFTDDMLVNQLARLWLEIDTAVRQSDRDEFEMAVVMAEEAVRRAQRRRTRQAFDESAEASISFVLDALGHLSSVELGELLGVSDRTIRSWQHDVPARPQIDMDRLVTLAQVLYDVLPSTTPRGAYAWLLRSNRAIGKSPLEALNEGDPGIFDELRGNARATRGQGA